MSMIILCRKCFDDSIPPGHKDISWSFPNLINSGTATSDWVGVPTRCSCCIKVLKDDELVYYTFYAEVSPYIRNRKINLLLGD